MNWNLLNTTLYLLLTNEALPIGNRHESIAAVLLEFGFAIDVNGFNGERIRLKAEYTDTSGNVDFITKVRLDSQPAGDSNCPKVHVEYTTRLRRDAASRSKTQ